MELKFNQLHEILKESEKAAVEAGNIIMNFKTGGFERLEKISGSSLASNTLTNADLYSQKAILKILNPIIVKFDLGLLAEESLDDNSRLIKDYFFAIDPLDGTKSFIEKDYGFAVSIALVSREGYPIIGVVYNPVNKNLYTSIKGHRLFRNGLELKKTPSLGNKKIIVDPGNKLNPVNGFEYVQYGGAVVNAISVLEGNFTAYIKPPKKELGGGSIWDFASTTLFFNEMNYFVSAFNGDKLNLNNPDTVFMNDQGVIFKKEKVL